MALEQTRLLLSFILAFYMFNVKSGQGLQYVEIQDTDITMYEIRDILGWISGRLDVAKESPQQL